MARTAPSGGFKIKNDAPADDQGDYENRSKKIRFGESTEELGDVVSEPVVATGGRGCLKKGRFAAAEPEPAPSNDAVSRALERRRAQPQVQQPENGDDMDEDIVFDESMNFDADEDLDNVESTGLKSKLRELQKTCAALQKQAVKLKMAKAPLEARMRQNDDNWRKEKNKLSVEIEALKAAIQEADQKFRSLELQKQSVDEENSKLTLENRRSNSTITKDAPIDNSAWSRQLANDKEIEELKEKLDATKEEIQGLKLDKISLESDCHASAMELDSLNKKFASMEAESGDIEAAKNAANEAEIRLEVLTREHIATTAQLNAVNMDLVSTKSTTEATIKEKETAWKTEEKQLRFEISVLRTRGGNVDDDDLIRPDDVEDEAVLRARIEERDRTIAELQDQVVKGEKLRRKMHNRIQELRGNIRVFVRTRPFLPGDGNSIDSAVDVSPDGQSLQIYDKTGKADNNFSFDKAFPPSSGQEIVFEEVSEFVQSALDGFHVCLFSYGQTGSGKTHTMQGSGNGQMKGIIPRAVEQILEQVNLLGGQNWKYTMTASFLEIYNEELKDLLVNMGPNGEPAPNTKPNPNKKNPKLAIKRNAEGKSFVDNLSGINIDTTDADLGMQQLENVMSSAARTRSVACTNMNAQSSRSHSVFMLHLHGYNTEDGTVVSGALNLCDLAGSERLDRSGAGADAKRLKETQAINKSLSCLGDVFSSLASGNSHVPFRNSKLTYLLQDCLSGDGKALMFVNLSPTMESAHESLCSLRFAQRVSQVELGKPTKHVQYKMGGKK